MKVQADIPKSAIDEVTRKELERLQRENDRLRRQVERYKSGDEDRKIATARVEDAISKIRTLAEDLRVFIPYE